MRILGRTFRSTVKQCGVVIRIGSSKDLEAATSKTFLRAGPGAAFALGMTNKTFTSDFVGIVVGRAFVFALLAAFIAGALLAHLLVEAVARALLAAGMAFATDGFASQRLQGALLLRVHILPVVAVGAFVVLHETPFHTGIAVDDRQTASIAAAGPDGVLRPGAALTGLMARLADIVFGILVDGADGDAVLIVFDMDAFGALISSGAVAAFAGGMAGLAGFVIELESPTNP